MTTAQPAELANMPKPAPQPATVGASRPQRQPPPGYKFVKVRNKQGMVLTVQRKLTPEELEAQAAEKSPSPAEPKPDQSSKAGERFGRREADETSGKGAAAGTPRGATKSVASNLPPVAGLASGKSVPAMSKSTTTSTSRYNMGAEGKKAVAEASTEEKAPSDATALEEAIVEQQTMRRGRKMQRFKASLWGGLGVVAGDVVPQMEVDDVIVSDESDFSDVSDDDLSDGPGPGGILDRVNPPKGAQPDNSNPGEPDNVPHDRGEVNSGSFQINTGAALTNAMNPASINHSKSGEKIPAAEKGTKTSKTTAKFGTKELEALDEKAAAEHRFLHRQWADASYYFMASLSILLPLLFLR